MDCICCSCGLDSLQGVVKMGLLVFADVTAGGYVVCLVFVDVCIVAFVVGCDVMLLRRVVELILSFGSVHAVSALGHGAGAVSML